jgi:hypothetical protein
VAAPFFGDKRGPLIAVKPRAILVCIGGGRAISAVYERL